MKGVSVPWARVRAELLNAWWPIRGRQLFLVAASASFLGSIASSTAMGGEALHDIDAKATEAVDVTPTAKLGINLDGLTDWGRTWMFVDVFKQSRPWSAGHSPGHFQTSVEKLALDEHGSVISLRPGQSATTYIFTDSDGHYPDGRYLARYEGDGEMHWKGDATVAATAPGQILLDVIPRKGIRLELTRTNPQNPIRNIRLYMPGFDDDEESPRFHPLFVDRLGNFSVLRFMDLQRTNDSQLQRWGQRSRPTDGTQAGPKGVALEHLMELVEVLDVDPWFCMPHMADDQFVRNFAELVRDHLPDGRKVYIEYSNEVWNGMFEQARFARDQGLALGLSERDYEAQLRFQSQRSVEIFRIWEDAFGGPDRLVRVLSTHFANPWATETVLAWHDAYKSADALAVAPYFGQKIGDSRNGLKMDEWDTDRLLQSLDQEISTLLPKIRALARTAEKKGLRLIAYEGGQHLVERAVKQNHAGWTALFHAANRHPGMTSLYRRYLVEWRRQGGGLFTLFSFVSKPSKWGSWGVLEWQDQPDESAPKWKAALEATEGLPPLR